MHSFTQVAPPRSLVAAVVLSMAAAAFAATTASDPYVPGQGRQALADELSLPLGEILVDRRCVYTRTDHWIAKVPVKTMSTCTVVATPTKLIIANYDSSSQRHVVDISFDYAQLKAVALNAKDGYDAAIEVEGKRFQVQFETDQGFISLTAWRSPQHVKPYDEQGAKDVFDVVASKGVPVVESKGRVDVFMTTPLTIFKH
jgi:hypothetical protein